MTSLFKIASFLSCYRLSKKMNLLQKEAEESQRAVVSWWGKNGSLFAGAMDCFLANVLSKGGLWNDSL